MKTMETAFVSDELKKKKKNLEGQIVNSGDSHRLATAYQQL